ncbi:MAG: DUF4433 domain-containing protein [Bacteroidia bacterium]|jgi:hypothetical protein|nr:DUF4433 domain-containing protein [Bacteroidia bacterium]
MTHIGNIPHILEYGITHSGSVNANAEYRPIGDTSIIRKRCDFELTNGLYLSDCIPFYFWGRMPMLYVIQNGGNHVDMVKPEEIVYCVCSLKRILELGVNFMFTDGHALAKGLTKLYLRGEVERINEVLDWEAIRIKYWKTDHDLDLKRRKEAEFLCLGDIPVNFVNGFVVYDNGAFDKLKGMGVPEHKVRVKRDFYF